MTLITINIKRNPDTNESTDQTINANTTKGMHSKRVNFTFDRRILVLLRGKQNKYQAFFPSRAISGKTKRSKNAVEKNINQLKEKIIS